MNCDQYQEDFIDYHDGTLPEERLLEIREHLKTCLDCQRAWAGLQALQTAIDSAPPPEPPDRVRRRFRAMLETQAAAEQSDDIFAPARRGFVRWLGSLIPASPVFQAAAMVVLLGGGIWMGVTMSSRKSDADIAEVNKRLDNMTRLMAYTASQTEPASDRVRTVLASAGAADVPAPRVSSLLNALALDSNVNVRLSALEALYPHSGSADVRSGVLAALARETSPIVQVAMIDFLTAAHASEARPLFERISQEPATNDSVRAAARRGISEFL